MHICIYMNTQKLTWFVWVYIYICICIYVYLCMYVYVFVYLHIFIYAFLYVHEYSKVNMGCQQLLCFGSVLQCGAEWCSVVQRGAV